MTRTAMRSDRGVPRAVTLQGRRWQATKVGRDLVRHIEGDTVPADVLAALASERPQTRSECVDGPRPCPWVGCRHHLYLDVNPDTGSIKLNFPTIGPEDLAESCSLDVADLGGITLEAVGEVMNLTRERVRQVEMRASFRARLNADPELGGGLASGSEPRR